MSNRMFSRPRVSMESLVEEVPAVIEEDVIEIATRPDPEALVAQAEVTDAADEVVAADTDVAELAEATDNLETYRAVLEESLEENGMDRAGAMAVQVGLDSTLSRIGTRISTPAMESYGTASNRIQATRLTIEAIGEKIKEIWEAIKAALMRAWEALKKFFASIFSSVERTRQLAQKVKSAAASTDSQPNAPTVEVKGAGAKIAINGKINDQWPNAVIGSLNGAAGTAQQFDSLSDLYTKVAQSLNGSVTEGMAAAGGVVNEYIDGVAKIADYFRGVGGQKVASSFKVPGIDAAQSDIVMAPLLPGNAVLFIATPKSGEGPLQLADVVARSKAGFSQLPVQGAVSDTFKVLSGDQISAIADATIAACDAFDGRKATLEKFGDAGSQLVKAGDALLNKAANEGEDVQARVRQTVQALPRLVENAGSWPKQTVSYGLGLANAGLKVAQASLQAYAAGRKNQTSQLEAPKPAPAGTPALAAPAA